MCVCECERVCVLHVCCVYVKAQLYCSWVCVCQCTYACFFLGACVRESVQCVVYAVWFASVMVCVCYLLRMWRSSVYCSWICAYISVYATRVFVPYASAWAFCVCCVYLCSSVRALLCFVQLSLFLTRLLGRNSSILEKGTSALLTVDLDDQLARAAKEVRVVQNKEPEVTLHWMRECCVSEYSRLPAWVRVKHPSYGEVCYVVCLYLWIFGLYAGVYRVLVCARYVSV